MLIVLNIHQSNANAMPNPKNKKNKVNITVNKQLLKLYPELARAGINVGDDVSLVGGRPDDRNPPPKKVQ